MGQVKSSPRISNYIVEAEGIYKFRWGDIIRYYLVKLLNANLKLRGCLYKHSSLYDSRNFFKKYLGKIYSKLTNKLHINNYEKKLSKIIFSSMLNRFEIFIFKKTYIIL